MSQTSWPKWAHCVTCWSDSLDCLAHYDSRKFILLPCCHFICAACADLLENVLPEHCPTCSRTLTYPPINPEITPLDYTPLSKKICTLCIRMGEAVVWCKDCDKLLCGPCAEHHPYAVVTSSHTLQKIEGEKCVHGEEYEFYCKKCGVAACKGCAQHEGHELVDLASYMEGELEELKEAVGIVRSNILEITEKSKKIETKLESLMSTERNKLFKEVDTLMAILLSALLKREHKLRESITKETLKVATNLKFKETVCLNELKSAFQFSHFIRSLVSSASSKKISPLEFARGIGIVKSQYPTQLELLRKYTGDQGDEYFELGFNFKLDTTDAIGLFEKETFAKISYSKTIEKSLETITPIIIGSKSLAPKKRSVALKRTSGLRRVVEAAPVENLEKSSDTHHDAEEVCSTLEQMASDWKEHKKQPRKEKLETMNREDEIFFVHRVEETKRSTPRPPGKREIKKKSDPCFVSLTTTPVKSPKRRKNNSTRRGRRAEINDDYCAICRDGGEDLVCCDRCVRVFHTHCHLPPLSGIPEGDFICCFCGENLPEKSVIPEEGQENYLKICRFLVAVWRLEVEYGVEDEPEELVAISNSQKESKNIAELIRNYFSKKNPNYPQFSDKYEKLVKTYFE